jgi:hypothetical protein
MKISSMELDALTTLMQKKHEKEHAATIGEFKKKAKIDTRSKAIWALIQKIPVGIVDQMCGGYNNRSPNLRKIEDWLLSDEFPNAPKFDKETIKAEIQILAAEADNMNTLRASLKLKIAI